MIYRHQGKILRRNGKIARHERCCCDPYTPCEACCNNMSPPNLLVRIEGIVANFCVNCALYNQTYFVPALLFDGQPVPCFYRLNFQATGPCGYTPGSPVNSAFAEFVSVSFVMVDGSAQVQVDLIVRSLGGGITGFRWRKTYNGCAPCMSFSEEPIPRFEGPSGGSLCGWTMDSTVFLTAA